MPYKNPLDDFDEKLREIFSVSLEDIQANDDGYLSDAQRKKYAPQLQIAKMEKYCAWVTVPSVLVFAIALWLGKDIPIGAKLSLTTMAILLINWILSTSTQASKRIIPLRKDFQMNVVKKVHGHLKLSEIKLRNNRKLYLAHMNAQDFRITQSQYIALKHFHGVQVQGYILYYMPNTHKTVAIRLVD